ncbi:Primary amine oxidase [Klebsiella pneumoniae]|nr:Primary amine oxidase [Klebsiella pneumoniae]
MANGLKFSPRKTALALAVAVVCAAITGLRSR